MSVQSVRQSARYVVGTLIVVSLALMACGPGASAPAASKPAAAPAQSQPAAAPAQGQAAAAQAAPAAVKPDLEPYKIGGTFVMSGDQAEFTRRQVISGMQMAIDDLNDKGGIDGHRVVPVYEDNKGNPQEGVAALRKLVEVDKVPVVHTIYTFITFAQIPVAEETKTVLFADGVEHPELTTRSQWTGRSTLNSLDNGLIIADFLGKQNIKKVVIIYEDQEGILTQIKPFEEKFTRDYSGQVLGKEAFKQGDTDFRNHIAKLRGLGADYMFVLGATSVEKPRILKQSREAGWNIPAITQSPFEDPEVLNVGGSTVEGVIFNTVVYTPEWGDRFQQKYGYQPDTLAAKYYDGLLITAEAIRRGGYTGEGVLRALNDIKEFDGALGRTVNNGQREWKPQATFRTVKDGKFAPYQQ